MTPLEVTPEMADRWNNFISRKRSGGNGRPLSPERETDTIILYNKCQSISQCARDMHMGRPRVKEILISGGVLA